MVALTAGDLFARDFRVVRELGRGGMGAVYVVEQLSTHKERALKLMRPDLVEDAKSRERFIQEARVGARIASEHVVEVIAAGVDEASGAPWLAMELLEGETLEERILRAPLSPREAAEVFRQLCHALGAAHAADLVHRDVKPDNVFLSVSRSPGVAFRVKLLDFGIAKLALPAGVAGAATAAVGTPLFMAPEQTQPGAIDARADVWALGLVVFRALTGHHYWRGGEERDVPLTGLLMEVLIDPLAPASERAARVGATLPEGFDAWFERCVSRDREARFPDASAAFAALEPVLARAPDPLAATAPRVPDTRPGYASDPARPAHAFLPTLPTPAEPAPARAAGSVDPAVGAPPARAERGASPLPWVVALVALVVAGAAIFVVATSRGGEAPPVARPPEIAAAEPPMDPMGPRDPARNEPTDVTTNVADAQEGGAAPIEAPPEPSPLAANDAPATPTKRERPAREAHSPADRASIATFERWASEGCQAWIRNRGARSHTVRVTQRLFGDGTRAGWTLSPDDPELRACFTQRAAYARWEGTGQDRVVRFRITLRPL